MSWRRSPNRISIATKITANFDLKDREARVRDRYGKPPEPGDRTS